MPVILRNPKMDKDEWVVHTTNDNIQQNISEYNNRNMISGECDNIRYEGKLFSVYDATPELVLEIKRRLSDIKDGGKETFIFHRRKKSDDAWARWEWAKRPSLKK